MTREEASNRLKQWIRNGCDGMTDEQLGYIEGWFHKSDKEALDMAIKALTALDKIYAELERSMKDYETDLMHFIPLLCVKETLDKYTKGESE